MSTPIMFMPSTPIVKGPSLQLKLSWKFYRVLSPPKVKIAIMALRSYCCAKAYCITFSRICTRFAADLHSLSLFDKKVFLSLLSFLVR